MKRVRVGAFDMDAAWTGFYFLLTSTISLWASLPLRACACMGIAVATGD